MTPYGDGKLVATPLETSWVEGREIPTRWRLVLPDRALDVTVGALNSQGLDGSQHSLLGRSGAGGRHTPWQGLSRDDGLPAAMTVDPGCACASDRHGQLPGYQVAAAIVSDAVYRITQHWLLLSLGS